jgi:hypothetical protein
MAVGIGLIGLGRRLGRQHSIEPLPHRGGAILWAHCIDDHGCADGHVLFMPMARLMPTISLCRWPLGGLGEMRLCTDGLDK